MASKRVTFVSKDKYASACIWFGVTVMALVYVKESSRDVLESLRNSKQARMEEVGRECLVVLLIHGSRHADPDAGMATAASSSSSLAQNIMQKSGNSQVKERVE